jgi:hypothetical protein
MMWSHSWDPLGYQTPMVPFLAERLKRTQVVGDLQKEAIATWRCHGIEFYPMN